MKIIWKLLKDNWLGILLLIFIAAFAIGMEALDIFIRGSILKHILGW